MNETENIKEILNQAQSYSQKLKSFKVSWRVFELKTNSIDYQNYNLKSTNEVVKPEIEILYE